MNNSLFCFLCFPIFWLSWVKKLQKKLVAKTKTNSIKLGKKKVIKPARRQKGEESLFRGSPKPMNLSSRVNSSERSQYQFVFYNNSSIYVNTYIELRGVLIPDFHRFVTENLHFSKLIEGVSVMKHVQYWNFYSINICTNRLLESLVNIHEVD